MPRRQKLWPPHIKPGAKERPISTHYTAIDNDLARDNLENDLPEGDLNDL